MTLFADSSAVVKLYADEDGAAEIRAEPGPLIVSQLARVEVPAALWRKHRIGELAVEAVAVLVAEFEFDYLGAPDEPLRFVAVACTSEVLDEAARLTGVHGLRAMDAVQLSSALQARRAAPGCTTMAAFDRALREAAATERFGLLP